MFCERCGAGLREGDLFCSQCGAPVKIQTENQYQEPFYGEEKYHFQHREERETYYDENLYRDDKPRYRDTFLEKKEEKSHALLVTVTILLVMAVLVAAVVVLFFFMKKGERAPGDGNAITIVSGENQEQSAIEADGDENVIVFVTESNEDAAGAGNDGQNAASSGQAENENSGQSTANDGQEEAGNDGQSADAASNAQPETAAVETQPATETEAAQTVLDVSKIRQIFSQDSTVNRGEVYVYDLKHFKEYATDGAGDAMYASALITVPILYTAAVKLDAGEITLNDQITYVNSIGGRGEAYPEERDGQNYPLTYYLTTMMSYSDNNCMNCLIDYLGLSEINRVCQSAGFSSVDLQRKIVAEVTDGKDNYVSAKDLAGMLKELYLGKYKTIGNQFITQYFKIDSGDGYRTVIGLADQIPSAALFLNQNGRGDTRYNEIALVSDDSHQYIISIMCNGDYGFQYETAVEHISNYVYQSLT